MNKKIINLLVILLLLFIYLPIFIVIINSFNSNSLTGSFESFSIEGYQSLFSNFSLIKSAINSILIALLSAYIATFIGALISYYLYLSKSPINSFLLSINKMNYMNPDIVIAVSMLILFNFLNIPLGLISVLLAHILFNIPVVIINVYQVIESSQKHLILSSFDLGASKWYTFKEIVFKSLQPTIRFVFIICLIYSMDDFIVTFFVTGNSFTTLPLEIYSMVRLGISTEINALFTIIIVTIVIGVLIREFRGEKKWNI